MGLCSILPINTLESCWKKRCPPPIGDLLLPGSTFLSLGKATCLVKTLVLQSIPPAHVLK